MARVRLHIQGQEVCRRKLRVRVDDINYGGHLGNDSVLTLCHEARIRFFTEIGHSEMDLYGKGIIMTDAMIVYRAEAGLGDELEISIYLDEIGKRGFDLYYLLERAGQEIARVKTGIAFFDYREGKIAACPEGFRERFEVQEKGV